MRYRPKKHSKISLFLLASITFLWSNLFAANLLTITPTDIPLSLSDGETGIATYTVKNNSTKTVSGYVLKIDSLKGGIGPTQNLNQSGSCPRMITLKPKASCILQLSIAQPMNTSIKLCSGTTCSQAAAKLNVKLGGRPLVLPGKYSDGVNQRPLLAVSNDKGVSWSYPSAISNLTVTPSDLGILAQLIRAKCTSAVCMAIGSNEKSRPPLLAISTNKGLTWSYSSEFTRPQGSLTDFSNGVIYSLDCTNKTCVIAGSGSKLDKKIPFLAVTRDAGATWIKPTILNIDLKNGFVSSIKKVYYYDGIWFAIGSLDRLSSTEEAPAGNAIILRSTDNGGTWRANPTQETNTLNGDIFASDISCSEKTCIAVSLGKSTFPVALISKNLGLTWSKLNIRLLTNPLSTGHGSYLSVHCIKKTCLIGGTYEDTTGKFRPLLHVSQDLGATWKTPIQINQIGASDINNNNDGMFSGVSSVSCSGTYCIATVLVFYQTQAPKTLIAVSKDSGVTWALNNLLSGKIFANIPFESSCTGVICMVWGLKLESGKSKSPFLGISTNRGATWSYPLKIQNPASLTPKYMGDGSLGFSNGNS